MPRARAFSQKDTEYSYRPGWYEYSVSLLRRDIASGKRISIATLSIGLGGSGFFFQRASGLSLYLK